MKGNAMNSGISRRLFMGAAGAAPVALALPISAATIAQPAVATAAAREHPWVWRLSYDGGEVYYDEFETKEQALSALHDCGDGAVIAECKCEDFDLYVDFDDLYEAMLGHNEEAIGEGEFIEVKREHEAELEGAVNAVIAAWAEKYCVNQTAWTFAEVRNKITASGAIDEAAA